MLEYIPLYVLTLVWIIFAVVQDLRTREISNWLNFSLIAFALAYRAFYSVEHQQFSFLLFGLGGFALFWVLAYALYYSRAFAGGDAKLLMGLGAVLPFTSYWSYALFSFMFLLLLFSLGALYSLIYTVFLAVQNKKEFVRAFREQASFFGSQRLVWSLILGATTLAVIGFLLTKSLVSSLIVFGFVFISAVLLIYTKAIEKACFVKLVSPKILTEGDWLVKDVKLAGKTIRATVHGLDKKDIILLNKYNKKVLVKYGIPFGPAFLFAMIGFLFVFYRFPDFLHYFGF